MYRKMRHTFFVCLIALSGLYLSILGVLIVLPWYFSEEKINRFQDTINREYHHYRSEVADLGAADRVKRVYNGRVLIEFCERVLAGRISAQSNVLVVSPEDMQNGVYTEETTSGFVHFSQNNGPANTVLSIALKENHIVHALPPLADLNSWWNEEATSPATT